MKKVDTKKTNEGLLDKIKANRKILMFLFNASSNYQRKSVLLQLFFNCKASHKKLIIKSNSDFFEENMTKSNVQYNNLSSALNCQINDIIDSNQRFFFER